MAAKTQLGPCALPGRRYTSFSGRAAVAGQASTGAGESRGLRLGLRLGLLVALLLTLA